MTLPLDQKPTVDSTPPFSAEYCEVYDSKDENRATIIAALATGYSSKPFHQQGRPSLEYQSIGDPGDGLYSEIPEKSSIQGVYAEVLGKVEDYEYSVVEKNSVTSIL